MSELTRHEGRGPLVDSPRISRRKALERAAVAGGAFVAMTPAVQHIARGLAHAQVSPPPGRGDGGGRGSGDGRGDGGETTFHGISYAAFVFHCDTQQYKVKWENGGFVEPGNLPHCEDPPSWDTAAGLPAPGYDMVPEKGAISVQSSYIDGELHSIAFTLPAGCTATGAAGGAMSAGGSSTEQGYCASATVAGNTVTFTAPSA